MKAALMLAASACALCAYPALAQSMPTGEPRGEEIIVTATKRSQSLQKIPLAITAVDGRMLATGGVMEVRALPQIAPSLFISTSISESAGTQVRLRGVGTSSQNAGFEGSVGIFEDGVYLIRPGEAPWG